MKILDLFDQFLFDLDGVIYIGADPAPYAVDVIRKIRAKNKKVFFLTNNPTKSRRQYAEKLRAMKIQVSENEVVTSCQAVNYYLRVRFKDLEDKSAYVIGSRYLKNEVRRTGISLVEGKNSRSADIVVVGGHSGFNYKELMYASFAIQNGAFFLATNRDTCYPTEEGLMPATGAIVASVEASTCTRAHIAGKPEGFLFEYCLNNVRERTIMIGDNISTDIAGAKKAGISSALVLTGYTKPSDPEIKSNRPDYILHDLSQLINDQEDIHFPD